MEKSKYNGPFQSEMTILQATKNTKGRALDILQAAIGHTPMWPGVRGRVLRLFGEDGLEGFIKQKELFNSKEKGKGNATEIKDQQNIIR